MTKVASPELSAEPFNGGGNNVVDRINAGVGTLVAPRQVARTLRDSRVDGNLFEQSQERLRGRFFLRAHTGQYLDGG